MAVPGCATNECPVSLISGYSRLVVSHSARALMLGKSGINVFSEGAGLSAKFVDALEVIAGEKQKVDELINISQETS